MKAAVAAVSAIALTACSSAIQIGELAGRTATTGNASAGTGSSSASIGSGTSGTTGGRASSNGGSTTGYACDPPCPANVLCDSNHFCVCPAGYEDCPDPDAGSRCIDIFNDNAHCGSCGRACPPSFQCSGGVCGCPLGSPCALDAGFGCFFLEDDPQHCGACDNPCAAPTTACMRGSCACPSGGSLCGDPPAGIPLGCVDTDTSETNCGSCANACADTFATGSTCSQGTCACTPGLDQLCAETPATDPPGCRCVSNSTTCFAPSFGRDLYPLLAEQGGSFGCSASKCHSGPAPAAGLAFLDPSGLQDAGMAYAELLGVGDAGGASSGIPACDGGTPSHAPSRRCACTSRVVPGDLSRSYLIDVLTNNLPGSCDQNFAMPIDDGGHWLELDSCANQLVAQWVLAGAPP